MIIFMSFSELIASAKICHFDILAQQFVSGEYYTGYRARTVRLGPFAVGQFAVGLFAVGTLCRRDNSPCGQFAVRTVGREDFSP